MALVEFFKLQEQTFDSFCKAVIRNESATLHRLGAAKRLKEVGFDDLSTKDIASTSHSDVYHSYYATFMIRGETVLVFDQALAVALQHLTPKRRDVILLYFFLGNNDRQIGKLLNISPNTVSYRRSIALKRLKEFMEGFEGA